MMDLPVVLVSYPIQERAAQALSRSCELGLRFVPRAALCGSLFLNRRETIKYAA